MDNKAFENELIDLLYNKGIILTEEEADDILNTLLAEGYTISKEEDDDTCPYYTVSTIQVSSALHPFQIITKKIARCMGTKEMDECSCEGHKSKCDRDKEILH